MPEFTGERVIPGLVDADLFNEHLSRYKFAGRLIAAGAVALDLGCGTGYGTAELSAAGSVTACDIAAEAVQHAQANFGRYGVRFVQASCDKLPFAEQHFDAITAFEVIEHVENWRDMLSESHRLLKPGGLFIVSTPNKAYYAETRAATGPNPFHNHEFEYAEFESALYAYFPHVRIWTQNHSGAIVFAPANPSGGLLEAEGSREPETAHFFVAVCSAAAFSFDQVFAWVPQTGNVLREREGHIAKLEGFLSRSMAEHASLQKQHEATLEELRARNRWAEGLNETIAEFRNKVAELESDASERYEWIGQLEARISELSANAAALQEIVTALEGEVSTRTDWARNLEADLATRNAHVKLLLTETKELTGTIESLVRRNESVLGDVAALKAERAQAARSKWMQLGKKLHVGPVLPDTE